MGDERLLQAPQHPGTVPPHTLRLKRLGIDTHQETVVYMRDDCAVCRAEGLAASTRVAVEYEGRVIIATLGRIRGALLDDGEASLSEAAWKMLGVSDGDTIAVRHTTTIASLSDLRAKIYGNRLDAVALRGIIGDVAAGRYSDIHLSAFVTACSGGHMDRDEITHLTRAMIGVGSRLDWGRTPIADKHCVGGLPGNRTTPIVVAIAAAAGLTIPKTSSRAITSPAGTADTMETLAPVELDLAAIRRVVEQEGGCIVWGGAVQLSPADDVLIRVERALDLDSEGQLVASVLSKKAAAGATHLVLDLPVGPTAKVRGTQAAARLEGDLLAIAQSLGIRARALITDGTQPVGRGIGPALEARDVLAVLRNEPSAPADLRNRALGLAAALLELVGSAPGGHGRETAAALLDNGTAWAKFQAICEAQGGMREPPVAAHTHVVDSHKGGTVATIDNRRLARIAKLAGAPHAKAAGVLLHVPAGRAIEPGEPLFTVHAETQGELAYALQYVAANPDVVTVEVVS